MTNNKINIFNNSNTNLFHTLKNEFVYGAHISALVSVSLVLTILILMNYDINILAAIIPYFITFIVYSFNYHRELDIDYETDPDKVAFLKKRNKIFPFIIISYLVLLLILLGLSFYLYGNYGFIMFILILLTGGILYTVVFKVLTSIIPGFKSIYVTGLLAYAGSFYVIFFYDLAFTNFFLIMLIFIFLKMFINVVFFDIKDITADSKKNLKTIPVLIGKNKTIFLLSILNLISLIILIYSIYINIIPQYGIGLSLFFFYTQYYLLKSINSSQKSILKSSYILADFEFILWPFILYITKIIYLKYF